MPIFDYYDIWLSLKIQVLDAFLIQATSGVEWFYLLCSEKK